MWIKGNATKFICDHCNGTFPLLDAAVVRSANIHVMDICRQCVGPVSDKIAAFRTPEAAEWYAELLGLSPRTKTENTSHE